MRMETCVVCAVCIVCIVCGSRVCWMLGDARSAGNCYNRPIGVPVDISLDDSRSFAFHCSSHHEKGCSVIPSV